MGLDIHLYAAAERAANDAHDTASNAFYERPDYDRLTDEQKDEIRATIPAYASQVAVPSERYPSHLFNRRYLRSSYNGGGFNHAVPDFVGSAGEDEYPGARGSIYWIFEPLGREWDYGEGDPDPGTLTTDDVPKLIECRKRAEQVAGWLRESDRLRVITVSANQLSGTDWINTDAAKALEMARAAAEGKNSGGWWSGHGLDWFDGTLKVIAAVPGGTSMFMSKLTGSGPSMWPCVHLVYKAEGDGFDSYVESAEIIAEFCDEAIGLIEQDGSAYVSWSG